MGVWNRASTVAIGFMVVPSASPSAKTSEKVRGSEFKFLSWDQHDRPDVTPALVKLGLGITEGSLSSLFQLNYWGPRYWKGIRGASAIDRCQRLTRFSEPPHGTGR